MKKTISLENVNLFILNKKINDFMAANGINAVEPNCRLVKLVLRHKTHHFPINVPFIAVVKKCENEGQVVFALKRAKIAFISDDAIAAEAKVSKQFVVNGITYQQKDTVNGYPRYAPYFEQK